MKRSTVVVVGLCALAAFLLSKRASAPTVRNDDLQRWEDDGGYLPEVEPLEGHRPAVTVDIHST